MATTHLKDKHTAYRGSVIHSDVKVKEVDLYSAFIEVPLTQGAQVQITHVLPANYTVPASTSYKHSQDGASPD